MNERQIVHVSTKGGMKRHSQAFCESLQDYFNIVSAGERGEHVDAEWYSRLQSSGNENGNLGCSPRAF